MFYSEKVFFCLFFMFLNNYKVLFQVLLEQMSGFPLSEIFGFCLKCISICVLKDAQQSCHVMEKKTLFPCYRFRIQNWKTNKKMGRFYTEKQQNCSRKLVKKKRNENVVQGEKNLWPTRSFFLKCFFFYRWDLIVSKKQIQK